jgi:hypothetical protein
MSQEELAILQMLIASGMTEEQAMQVMMQGGFSAPEAMGAPYATSGTSGTGSVGAPGLPGSGGLPPAGDSDLYDTSVPGTDVSPYGPGQFNGFYAPNATGYQGMGNFNLAEGAPEISNILATMNRGWGQDRSGGNGPAIQYPIAAGLSSTRRFSPGSGENPSGSPILGAPNALGRWPGFSELSEGGNIATTGAQGTGAPSDNRGSGLERYGDPFDRENRMSNKPEAAAAIRDQANDLGSVIRTLMGLGRSGVAQNPPRPTPAPSIRGRSAQAPGQLKQAAGVQSAKSFTPAATRAQNPPRPAAPTPAPAPRPSVPKPAPTPRPPVTRAPVPKTATTITRAKSR